MRDRWPFWCCRYS